MADRQVEVEENAGEVAVTILRTGDLTSDLEVYCYTVTGNNHESHLRLI